MRNEAVYMHELVGPFVLPRDPMISFLGRALGKEGPLWCMFENLPLDEPG
jgi:hypothetical protein